MQVHDWSAFDRNNPEYIALHPYAASVKELVVHLARRLPSDRGQKYVFVTDNYFTSPAAFLQLMDLGHHAVGTVKSRSGIPQHLMWKKKDARRPPGTATFLRTTDRKLLLQEWQDSGLVRVLSTGMIVTVMLCMLFSLITLKHSMTWSTQGMWASADCLLSTAALKVFLL